FVMYLPERTAFLYLEKVLRQSADALRAQTDLEVNLAELAGIVGRHALREFISGGNVLRCGEPVVARGQNFVLAPSNLTPELLVHFEVGGSPFSIGFRIVGGVERQDAITVAKPSGA